MIRRMILSLLIYSTLALGAAIETQPVNAFVVSPECIVVPRDLVLSQIVHSKGRFYVIDEHQIMKLVEPYNIDKELNDMSDNEFIEFLQNGGSLKLSQKSDGEYSLVGSIKLCGGGPVAAFFAANVVRVVGYGAYIGAVAGAAVIAVATAPAGAVMGIGAATQLAGYAGAITAYVVKVEQVAKVAYLAGMVAPTA